MIDHIGAVREVSALSGPPLLRQAAVDAVAGWRYRPTRLNGVAVAVRMSVTVVFTLSR